MKVQFSRTDVNTGCTIECHGFRRQPESRVEAVGACAVKTGLNDHTVSSPDEWTITLPSQIGVQRAQNRVCPETYRHILLPTAATLLHAMRRYMRRDRCEPSASKSRSAKKERGARRTPSPSMLYRASTVDPHFGKVFTFTDLDKRDTILGRQREMVQKIGSVGRKRELKLCSRGNEGLSWNIAS